MQQIKKILIIVCFMLGILIAFNLEKVEAVNINLDSLKYNIQLNADGSMDVVETWSIQARDVNTMFKTFQIDGTYSNITGAEVYEITSNGTRIPFEYINQEMYHVPRGAYYALVNSNRKFEIAWGVSITGHAIKVYEIKYKVNGCIKRYNDCAEVYWTLINSESSIPADRVTVTIRLPRAVSVKDNLRAWAHGPLNGNVIIDSTDTVILELDYLDANTPMEFRIACLETGIFSGVTVINQNRFDTIISEETKLADKANEWRNEYIRSERKSRNSEKNN